MRSKVMLAFRRIAAFMVDWLVLAVYAAGLFMLVSPLVAPLFADSPFTAELVGFVLLTLPMVLYFSLMEASSWQATIGKRVLRLRVAQSQNGRRLKYPRSLLRSVVKFLSWELAHFAVWNVFVFTDSPAQAAGIGALALSYLLIFAYGISLFVKSGRTPYDLAAKSIVRFK